MHKSIYFEITRLLPLFPLHYLQQWKQTEKTSRGISIAAVSNHLLLQSQHGIDQPRNVNDVRSVCRQSGAEHLLICLCVEGEVNDMC